MPQVTGETRPTQPMLPLNSGSMLMVQQLLGVVKL